MLEVEKLQFSHNAQLGAFLQTAPGNLKGYLAQFRLDMSDHSSALHFHDITAVFHLQAKQSSDANY